MNQFVYMTLEFVPPTELAADVARTGLRLAAKGTHTSRTIMLGELSGLLAALPADADRADYAEAIIGENLLAKQTTATRRLTNKRLAELYALDPAVPLFRVLRRLWNVDAEARPQLALLAALARDPLLRASAAAVLALEPGEDLRRDALRATLRAVTGERLNDATLEKVLRNTASSWTQAGHLIGRTFKTRHRVQATPTAISFALWLGQAAGFRGPALFHTGWTMALDCPPHDSKALALEAKRLGLIDLRIAENAVELGLDRLDPSPWRR